MPDRSTKTTPFSSRTRQAQKRAYRGVVNNIRRAAPMLGGRFYTHHYMHGENGWIDGYFLGVRKPIFYNFTLQTVPYVYKELVESRAWDMSFEVAPTNLDASNFERAVKDPTSIHHVAPPREPCRYPELNGMTRYAWTQAQCQQIADSLEFKVFEHWTLHHNYRTGIGLNATVDVPFLTVEAVNAFIDRFLQSEAEFTSQEPRTFRFDQIAHWGIEANSIAHPWQWNTG